LQNEVEIKMKKIIYLIVCVAVTMLTVRNVRGAWDKGRFRIEKRNGRPVFIDPSGEPFYSVGMVYAFGPESPEYKNMELTEKKVINDLKKIKKLGFNTINLYGEQFIDSILSWCDENEMALYIRTKYSPDDFPDFMSDAFRNEVKNFYYNLYKKIKGHPSVQAVDMDQRWMFYDVDWAGKMRPSLLVMKEETRNYFQSWLKKKYRKIKKLNKVWGKEYRKFSEVLDDSNIFSDSDVLQSLKSKPWRFDVLTYLEWAENDFLKEITSHMKRLEPGYLVTYTTEMPENFVFPFSTKKNSGIDFISPVHYNNVADYGNDWISAAKLLFHYKFHHDLQSLPVYISETGFRTDPLNQKPPSTTYAFTRSGDEDLMAKLYIEQSLLLNTLPYMTGWGYFKFYDKWQEGDFGFVRDDGSDKPITRAGRMINYDLTVNYVLDVDEPKYYIYCPSYLIGSQMASYQQYKTLCMTLEGDFFKEYNKLIEDIWKSFKNGKKEYDGMDKAVKIYNELWVPFAFKSIIPGGKNPMLLAGRALEQLSYRDRKELMKKRTVSFGKVGVTDEYFNPSYDWALESVEIKPEMYKEEHFTLNMGISGEEKNIKSKDNPNVNFKVYKSRGETLNYIRAEGQRIKIKEDKYKELHLMAASLEGDLAEKIKINYAGGKKEEKYMDPTVCSLKSEPHFSEVAYVYKEKDEMRYLSHITIPVDAFKKIDFIELPNNPDIAIYAVSATKYGETAGQKIKVECLNTVIEGYTSRALILRPDLPEDIEVLARFGDGSPAAVKSRDGKHITFLFDMLTWSEKEDEISSNIYGISDIIKKIVGELK